MAGRFFGSGSANQGWLAERVLIEMAQIRFFVAAAKVGSFRGAAESLNVRQSSISRGVRRLEDRLGVSLFERSHGGVRMTDAGRQFFSDVQPAIEQLKLAETTAAAAGRAEIGVVRVGVPTSLAGGFLRQLIHEFGLKFPEVTVDICDGGPDDHIAAIRSRRLDIAFVAGIDSSPHYETAELWRERIHVALSQSHRLAKRKKLDWPDLASERFIVSQFAPGPAVRGHINRRARDCDLNFEIAVKAVLPETLLNLVGLGQGLTLVCDAWAAVRLPDLVFRPLSNVQDIISFSAVWSSRNDNPALRRFISIAHILAGQVRHGSSDWAQDVHGLAAPENEPSGDKQRHEPTLRRGRISAQ